LGSYIIRPTNQDSFNGIGNPFVGTNSVEAVHDDDADYIDISTTSGSRQIRYNFSGASIYLDGSITPTSFQNLPSGWTPLSATLIADGSGTLIQALAGTPGFGPTIANMYLQFDTFSEKLFTITAPFDSIIHTLNGPFNYSLSSVPSALDLINNGCGVRIGSIVVSANHIAETIINRLYISGTYGINQFSFTLSDNGSAIFPNNNVTITSPDGGLNNLYPNGGVSLTWRNPNNGGFYTYYILLLHFKLLTPNIITFPVFHDVPPYNLPPPGTPVNVVVTGNGVQFSGSIAVGSFILITNGSGIYQITKDKRNDTIYDRLGNQIINVYNTFELEDEEIEEPIINKNLVATQGLPEDEELYNDVAFVNFNNIIPITVNVKIPDPFVKGGFIGS